MFVNTLRTVNGRILRLPQWVHSLDFAILGNKVKSPFVTYYLTVIGYSYIVFPFITLVLWVALLIKDASKNDAKLDLANSTFIGAISVLLLGLALVLWLLTMTKIFWNNHRFKLSHMLMLSLAYVLLTAWQFMVMLSSIDGAFSFKALAAVLLTQSGMVMSVLVYLNLYENKFNLLYFMEKFVERGDASDIPDPERKTDMLEEIEA